MATNRPVQTPGQSQKAADTASDARTAADAQQAAAGNASPANTAAANLAAAAVGIPETVDTNPVKVTPFLQGTVDEQLAAEKAKTAELTQKLNDTIAAANAIMAQAQALRVGVEDAPAKPKLPTLAQAKADAEARVARGEPVHAVLTQEGHYVHPMSGYQSPAGAIDPKTVAAMVTTLVNAQAAASSLEASKPKARASTMEEGTGPAKVE